MEQCFRRNYFENVVNLKVGNLFIAITKEITRGGGGGGGGYSGIFWVGMCRPGLQIWTPF